MSRIAERIISSDDYLNAFDALIAGLGMATILNTSQGGFGQDVSAKTGSVVFYSGTAYFPDAFVTPEMFGGSAGADASTNTTAINLAVATGKPVLIPLGDYNVNAWDDVAAGLHLFGMGRGSKLIFNTTGVGINLNDVTPDQGQTYHIHDLAFANVTNAPEAFIRNLYPVNSRFERLYFSSCAATYCIDNENGYGTKISDCVFSDVTGSAIRLQDDGAVTKYSYAAIIDGCDITRMSGDGIDIDGTGGLTIIGGIIEGCTGYGIRTNYRASAQIATVQSWGINIHGTYFEGNGTDIGCETAAAYTSRITMVAPTFNGVSAISLGAYGRLVVVGGQISGGSTCTISGSSDARVTLVGHVEHNFTQLGTFQWNDLGQYYDSASTPEWIGSTTNPVGGAGTVFTSHWSRTGHRATLDIYLCPGAGTTFGTGTYYFRDALLTEVPATHPDEAVGTAMLYDASGAYQVGAVYFTEDDHTLAIAYNNGYVTTTAPWTWDADDVIRLSITYRC